MDDPMMFAESHLAVATDCGDDDVTNSGMEFPMATIVSPMTVSETPWDRAIRLHLDQESTSQDHSR